MENKLPKAEEFYDKKHINGLPMSFNEKMVEFARLYVEAALTEASKTIKCKEQITMQGLQVTIIKSSILNAYPLTNIK